MSIHPLCVATLVACCVGVCASADVGQDVAADAAAPPASIPDAGVQAADASQTSHASPDVLQRLAADLALENLLLTRRLQAAEQAATPGLVTGATLPDDLPQVEAAMAALEDQLDLLRLHRAALLAASPAAGEASGVGAGSEPGGAYPGEAQGEAQAQAEPSATPEDLAGEATEIRVADKGSVPYRYRYSFGLIGQSGRGRVVLRGQNGVLRGESYNFNEFRDDAVWVKLLFRNDGKVAQRFTGAMALGHRTLGLGRSRIRVLATVSVSTPVLQPGEIHEIDREIRVDAVRDVDFVEVGKVRSFSGRE